MGPRSFVVSVLCCVGIAASNHPQQPGLDAVALPAVAEAALYDAPPGAVLALVLGLQQRRVLLPGGLVLGVTPDVVGGVALAAADGSVTLTIPLDAKRCAGLRCYAQGLALPAALPPQATPLRRLEVPERGAEADVYVLFGQSNAEGYAPVEGLPLELVRAMPRSRVWALAARRFEALTAGRNGRTLTSTEWCGPELTLLRALAANGRTAYLVKVGIGQTSLGPQPGSLDEWGVDAGRLYPVLLATIAGAAADLRAQGLAPRVRGVMMMQGESDATSAALAAGYATALQRLVLQMRADLAAAAVDGGELVPFVFGRIRAGLPVSVFPFVDGVRQAQLAVATQLAACAVVETSGLSVLADQTHFDTAGVMELGLLFAGELQRLRSRR